MKNVLLLTFISTFLLSTSQAIAVTSYPMTCRGGSGLHIYVQGNDVNVSFRPGRGATTDGLKQGQCTWSDRALGSEEPKKICDSVSNAQRYVANLLSKDKYTILQVYNKNGQCMKVTRVGP